MTDLREPPEAFLRSLVLADGDQAERLLMDALGPFIHEVGIPAERLPGSREQNGED